MRNRNEEQSSPYMYFHRVARIYRLLATIDVQKGRKFEFMSKTSMIGNMLTLTHADKLLFEGGMLSFIPQFAEKDCKVLIKKNFGPDVAALVYQTEELRQEFIVGSIERNIKSYSTLTKTIHLYQTYLELTHAFAQESGKVYFDGEVYIVKDGQVNINGVMHPIEKFHQFIVQIVEWKLPLLEYSCHTIRQCLREVLNQYSKQKGFAFQLAGGKLEYGDASTNQEEVEVGTSAM